MIITRFKRLKTQQNNAINAIKIKKNPIIKSFKTNRILKKYYHSSFIFLNETKTETKVNNGNGKNGNEVKNGNEEKKSDNDEKDFDPRDEKIIELESRVEELTDGWKRALAELDNARKIMQRDIDRLRETGNDKLLKSIIPVVDILNLGLNNKPSFDKEEYKNNEIAKSAFNTVEGAKNEFIKVLEKFNVEEFVPKLGDKFDPHTHNALFPMDKAPNPTVKPGTIGAIVKSGFKRNDLVLRASVVGVLKD
jgi:molecular chaperone GrpE